MKLLLDAALRSRRHLYLFIITFFTLLCLTISSQMEMFALGVLSNNGADFFTLFSRENSQDVVSLKEVQEKWDLIDKNYTGLITKQQAISFIAQKSEGNPLSWMLAKVKQKFRLSHNIKALVLVLISVAIFKAIWLFASRYTTQLLAIRVSRDLRQQYFEHIQSLPMSFYQQHNIGSLSARVVGDAGQIATSINSWLTNYLQTPFTIITCLSMCFYLSWRLSLVIFFGVPLIIIPIVFLARRVKRASRQLQKNQESFANILIEFLAGIQTVKIFSMEGFSLRKYKEQNERMAILESKTAKYGLLTRPILHAITTLCLACVVLFGLYTIGMSLSQLIVFCGMLQLVYEPVKKFADENGNIQRGIVAAERMFEVLHIKPDIQDHPDATELTGFFDSIEFDKVWFRYQGDWILKNISFTVRKGETIAIIGPTGAGKSTIVQLMPRLYDIQQGEVRIDGRSLKTYTQKSLREHIAFVSQKPFLFCDTISANIAFGRPFTNQEIEEAAKKAHAEEFIIHLPNQYQSILAESGQNLSGGQQQRLAIARALVKKAPILILDEATSSLDSISEMHIKDAIISLKGEITQIIIAHRLSTIEHADKIIYLSQGAKIAEGTKEQLLENCPEFRRMWEVHYNLKKTPEKSLS
ncbi:ABC transporter ATP-binding protein [Candidatus Rhabdochlamydia porcellionis]|jgi:ABC-type multidrug transport system fused ATPase/permease subunit|uniref:Vitamin B12 import ATP-binding protein BtuD n=1 Tax=Candidatus Rhabdochlamydia porcellionis TaxID=225148 RepID=A0ABX8YZX8_9BACT|nr:ABC transporter ATP-binding protein [Candidatus Rhabdochlamydia porcellionis]QZA58939.1 Vitamin B12 import ATP-binding protein BtuD [Candidatus Rhabdochlamydia porcellionis]